MSSRLVFVSLLFMCYGFHFVQCTPNFSNEYPHVVPLYINNFALYTLTTEYADPLHDDNVATVLETFLTKHHISVDRVNVEPAVKTLKEKIKWMRRKARSVRNSSTQKGALFKKWKDSDYTFNLWHRSGSPTKRKVKELEEELEKVKVELNTSKSEKEEIKNEKEELEDKVKQLSNPKKCLKRKRGNKSKDEYSKRQKKRHETNILQNIKVAVTELAEDESLRPIQVKLLNELGEEVVINFKSCVDEVESCSESTAELDEIVYILDYHNVAIRGYHSLARKNKFLYRACQVKNRRQELNSMIDIKQVDGKYIGAYTSVRESIIRLIRKQVDEGNIVKDKVRVKLSGDGTRITCKQSFVNVAITFPDHKDAMSEHGNHLIAIIKCPEKNDALKAAIHDLIEEFENLNTIFVDGKEILIEKYLGGDLKFLNQIIGISSFSGKYSCLWCNCSSSERFDMSKNWSCTDVGKGARTIQTVIKNSKKKSTDPTKFGCVESPLFQSVPIHRVIVDTLHLCLRIGDQLVGHLVSHLQTRDNITKVSSKTNIGKCGNLQRFSEFVNEVAKITDWHFFINDGKIQYRPLRGPEHRRLMDVIDLDHLIPLHPKLTNLKRLWQEFPELLKLMDQNLSPDQIDQFEDSARAWVSLYYNTYCSTDITPYMHVLACHIPEMMRLHGNISHFCQQGLEKVNDLVTKWYHRSTNFGAKSMSQILAKQHRLQTLGTKFKPQPLWNVQCSKCNQTGHNKRSCIV